MSNWTTDMHMRIAGAIKKARGKRSAQWLADRTAELGYPITRAQIANYESGRKQSLDIAELIVIAAALNTSPVNLVYPGPYQGAVEILPGRNTGEFNAAEWFSGVYSYLGSDGVGAPEDPAERWQANTETLRLWRELDELVIAEEQMDNPEHIALLNRQIKSICDRLGIAPPPDEAFGRNSIEFT